MVEVRVRTFVLLVLGTVICAPASAQEGKFPLTAKVVSSGVETVPDTGGVATVRTPPALRQQFPNAPASSTKVVKPETYVTTKAEIGDRIYTLRGGALVDPGEYPASIDKRTIRLLLKDKDEHGKPKIAKLYVISVAAKQ
jgi:hypothetical protein